MIYFPIAITIAVVIAIHEAGHLLAAWVLGVRIVRIGFDWRGVYIVRDNGKPWQNAIVTFAGPLANLITVYVALRFVVSWELCLFSLELGVYNLLPLPGSDGLRLMRIARNWLARSAVSAQTS